MAEGRRRGTSTCVCVCVCVCRPTTGRVADNEGYLPHGCLQQVHSCLMLGILYILGGKIGRGRGRGRGILCTLTTIDKLFFTTLYFTGLFPSTLLRSHNITTP